MSDVEIRQLRPADRERVVEMVADVWDGEDYLPRVFDRWVADPAGSFVGAEVDGVLAGVQRVTPIAAGVDYLEGLRVASTHRRQGIARELVRFAIAESRGAGRRVLRLGSANPDAIALFESEGFRPRVTIASGIAPAFEGGDPPRLARAGEVARLWQAAAADPGHAAQAGMLVHGRDVLDMDEALLRSLVERGQVRVNGRALAVVRPGWADRLTIGYVVGAGAALRDLLLGLRSEADSLGRERADVWIPLDHPAADDVRASGYVFPANDCRYTVLDLEL